MSAKDTQEAITEAYENVMMNYSTEPSVVRALLAEIDRLKLVRTELLAAAEQAYEEMGKSSRFNVSTVRQKKLKPVIRAAGGNAPD